VIAAQSSSSDASPQGKRPRVVIADPLAQTGVDLLATRCDVTSTVGLPAEEVLRAARGANILVVRSETKVTESFMVSCPTLELVGRAGAGVDNIDVDAATRLGILVVNAPTGNTIAAAEHTVAMMLAVARNIPAADHSIRQGKWDRKRYLGTELRGKTLGVIGLGRIGQEVCRIAVQGLGMSAVVFDPVVSAERAQQAGALLVDLPELLRIADVITVHVPLNDRTRGLIGATELATTKPGVRIINVARGGIIDETALAAAVDSGHVAGAALDVFATEPLEETSRLRQSAGIVLTPHLGASTEEAQVRVSVDLAEQVLGYLSGQMPRFAVNLPIANPGDASKQAPYLDLARRLARLAVQLSDGHVERVICSYGGDLASIPVDAVTSEVLIHLIAGFTAERVNSINARVVARERGIEVDERRVSNASRGAALTVSLDGPRAVAIGGDVVGDDARITSINGFPVDVKAEGEFLVVTHHDKPGVLAGVSSLLAARDINIGSVGLGRDQPRGRAVMVMQIDDPVPPEVLQLIQSEAGANSATLVSL
jgi:D-3-phosphoglycerate dehydrogenase